MTICKMFVIILKFSRGFFKVRFYNINNNGICTLNNELNAGFVVFSYTKSNLGDVVTQSFTHTERVRSFTPFSFQRNLLTNTTSESKCNLS